MKKSSRMPRTLVLLFRVDRHSHCPALSYPQATRSERGKSVRSVSLRNQAILFALLVFVAAANSARAGAGTSSAEFLKIPVFSRGTALSGTLVASADGACALFYNPAGIARHGSGELTLSHTELLQDLRLDNISFALPLKGGSGLGFGITYLGYGSIAGYDASGAATGNLSAYSLAFDIGYSQRVSEVLSAGIAAKPIFEKLDEVNASTITFDIGLMADLGQFTFGAQYANLGGRLRYVQEEVGLPSALRVGASYTTLGSSSVISIAGSKEEGRGLSLGAGIEYAYNSLLTFRAGYGSSLESQNGATDGVSLGLGLKLDRFDLDYSFQPSTTNEGVHQITGSYRFGR